MVYHNKQWILYISEMEVNIQDNGFIPNSLKLF